MSKLTLEPIGYIRTDMKLKFDAPHQPNSSAIKTNVIELLPGKNFEQALQDLKGFDRVWLVWWFHKNSAWRPLVLPPRGGRKKRGVFATRSPHRPNGLGLTSTTLLDVRGRKIVVGPVDLVDGTPILDIKPYIPEVDAFPNAAIGWLADVHSEIAEPKFSVTISTVATTQVEWLRKNWQIDFITRAREVLSLDPSPHRTRRITKCGQEFRMGCGAWRIYFSVAGDVVEVLRVEPGYPARSLDGPAANEVPDLAAQRAFLQKFMRD
ncbi:MAG: tRNA (N6-threonylcarbamoyladenosine(37)-N6)-methyltransferase TrmO [Oligoflexia bacterium]|nr:tRNA (N6-threonylcarbamoyladenosine(37)-N6)-methyltransferase TrmO [Oligoflexia bacterium]